jgi:hypothetical protein
MYGQCGDETSGPIGHWNRCSHHAIKKFFSI